MKLSIHFKQSLNLTHEEYFGIQPSYRKRDREI
jgi:hypothetical protein